MLGEINILSFVDFIRKLSRGFVLIEWVLTLKKLEGQRKTGLFSSSAPSGSLVALFRGSSWVFCFDNEGG